MKSEEMIELGWMIKERDKPKCCRHEPNYPDHETTIFVLSHPCFDTNELVLQAGSLIKENK